MEPSIHFGPEGLDGLADALRAQNAQRILVISGPSRRFVDGVITVIDSLGLAVEVFDGAQVHVPVEVVARVSTVVERFRPDVLISVGGGAATGLAKVLRRSLDAAFFAVPTTFSASEMTSIYGVTDGQTKQTGRDPRVRPDAVFYDVRHVRALAPRQKTTSLLNALAHPVSALSADTISDDARRWATQAIKLLVGAAIRLAENPDDAKGHEDGLRGASKAGQVLEAGQMGVHHRIAHLLGGRFSLAHSALHAVLLPHTLRALADTQPDVYEAIATAAQWPDLPGQLYDLLRRVGSPTSLRDMEVPYEAMLDVAGANPALPQDILQAVFHGRRPTLAARREDWGLRQPVAVSGAALGEARVVVVALHGRGSQAEAIAQTAWTVAGQRRTLAVVAPHAPNNQWYGASYRSSADTMGEALTAALGELATVVERVRQQAPQARLVLLGFSQGACLACEFVATRNDRVDALIAIAGARIGARSAYGDANPAVAGTSVLLGLGRGDAWVDGEDTAATAAWLEAGGAQVSLLWETAPDHQMSMRQRIRARALIWDEAPVRHRGFGNAHETEALPGALPNRMNSPRRVKYGLYAEQINGTGFVAHRAENLRSWLYRVRPAAQHTPFERLDHPTFAADFAPDGHDPNLCGWRPRSVPAAPTDFVDGMVTVGGAGDPEIRRGFALHTYVANRSMEARALCNSDGDLLLVPQLGRLALLTELGVLEVAPGSVALLPRGIKFSVLLDDDHARGYVAEVYGRHFELPERGPVGANGLTDARHFVCPAAWYEDRLAPGYRLTNKFCGQLYEARQDYSPYDVVAWHGNYAPYVYDLMDFGPVSNVRFDHPDPSIYTVLSAPMDEQGSHTLDFVFFPPRWDVTENTFRPPFFHRNATTEFNGIIRDPAGDRAPFYAGGYFMTPSMTAHGVMAESVLRAFTRTDDPPPQRSSEASMWFQFESALPIRLTRWAQSSDDRIGDWPALWGAYRTHFDPFE